MYTLFFNKKCVLLCSMLCLSDPNQRKWQTVLVGQAAVQIKGDRPQGSYLLTDGEDAGHLSRVSPATALPLSGTSDK